MSNYCWVFLFKCNVFPCLVISLYRFCLYSFVMVVETSSHTPNCSRLKFGGHEEQGICMEYDVLSIHLSTLSCEGCFTIGGCLAHTMFCTIWNDKCEGWISKVKIGGCLVSTLAHFHVCLFYNCLRVSWYIMKSMYKD